MSEIYLNIEFLEDLQELKTMTILADSSALIEEIIQFLNDSYCIENKDVQLFLMDEEFSLLD